MKSKWKAMIDLIKRMTDPEPKERPNCSEILCQSDKWLINPEDLNLSQPVKTNLIIENNDNFYFRYFSEKKE